MKTCSKCKSDKDLSDFYKDKSKRDGMRKECKTCQAAQHKLRRDSEDGRAYQKRYWESYRSTPKGLRAKKSSSLKFHYSMTIEDFHGLLLRQGGRCGICQTIDPGSRAFHVDHDHGCCPGMRSCGKCIRGLLCHKCNAGLGMFGDSVVSLTLAIQYLERNK